MGKKVIPFQRCFVVKIQHFKFDNKSETCYNTCIDTEIGNTMTKAEMIEAIADTSIDAMDIGELIAYAREMMIKELAEQSEDDIQEQYEYMS